MRFTKAHGAGNAFVVLPDRDDRIQLDAPLVRALCDVRTGLGADGVLRIVAGSEGADAFMDYRNADGGAVETCGNGLRVVAKHVVDHGWVGPPDGIVRIATRAGLAEVEVHRDAHGVVSTATVDMGAPDLDPASVPFDVPDGDGVDAPVTVGDAQVRLTAVSMGNPHAVLVVGDVRDAPVATLGPALERHERFPKGTNVEFASPLPDGDVAVRVWERGVGETAACGSGACAVLVALRALGRAGNDLRQRWPGGDLTVHYDPGHHPSVFLTGDAVEVASGELDPRWLGLASAR